jgi:hypothetical protein
MPDMPGLVARPRFMRLHDDFLNDSVENRRLLGLGLLSGQSLADVYRQQRIGGRADWTHLEREFYAEEGPLAYWPYNRYGYLGNKQEIMRQGILETIRVAEGLAESRITRQHFNRPWPERPVQRRVETWWVCSGSRFEVNVLSGDTQVTTLLLTPAMPVLPDNRKPKLEQDGFLWTIAHRDVLQGYIGEYRSDQSRYPTIKAAYKVARRDKESKPLGRINKFQE